MKKIKLYVTVLMALIVSSCNYLEFDESSDHTTVDEMYRYFANMKTLQTHIYGGVSAEFDLNKSAACDEAEYASTTANLQSLNNGSWSARNTFDVQWTLYEYIRSANEFLVYYQDVDFSRYEQTVDYASWMAQMETYEYEVRILRVYYFFELARRYGDIPMPLTTLSVEEANSISKTPFEDVIDYIVSECDECIEYLHVTFEDVAEKEVGRITKGFAMALKSRALLLAASELHNPDMDTDKWKTAAQAAYDIIETNYYMLDGVDPTNNLTSKEVVLFRMQSTSSSYELNNFPLRFTADSRSDHLAGTYPTQNLVDAFQTINGYSVVLGDDGWECEDSAFDPNDPYVNRDPRFYRTILANGMSLKGETIELFEGGLDDKTIELGGTTTGYYVRRHIQETTNFVTGSIVTNYHHWILYRYSETLLAYAESMIEAYGDANATGENDFSALEAINMVRANAGMPALESTPAADISTKEGFIEALRNEYTVEFAFESQRFWNIRRWCIGDQTQTAIYGVKITKDDSNLEFEKVLVEDRFWNDRMNLYPIPESELFLNSNLAPQNDGWE